MNAQAIRIFSQLRGVNQSRLAEMAGVTRQAVSLWFKAPAGSEVCVKSPSLRCLASALKVSADDLLSPLPILDDPEAVLRFEAELLWDRLYPSLSDFAVALVHAESVALARLVQVYGLYRAAGIAGPGVWKRFPAYRRHIRPIRREQLERVWQYHRNRT